VKRDVMRLYATEVRSLSRLRGRVGVGVLPQGALVEGTDLPPPAALSRAPQPKLSFGVLPKDGRPMAAYAPPQAGEVK
jgi:hypothetical protein